MDTYDIRHLLAARRRERGLTQAQLGALAQVSREMILRFEKGDHDIGLRRLLRLCTALDLDLVVRPGHGRPTLDELDELFKDDE
ncbi:MAG TPA: transcriptional regulator [Gammaproteobacteria bacterium]|nr:transcriptional regulator [Gammaproteobacteria bacterium]